MNIRGLYYVKGFRTMKKLILALGLSLALLLVGVGCTSEPKADSIPESTPAVVTPTPEPEPTVTPEPEPEPEPEPTPEPTQEPVQEREVELFKSVEEVVYATSTVNIRESYTASSNKVGSLTTASSITRTGIGTEDAEGWSRVSLSDGTTAYINSDYLSTVKPTPAPTPAPRGNSGTSTSSGSGTSGSSSTSNNGIEVNENGMPIAKGAEMVDVSDQSGMTEDERRESIENGTPGSSEGEPELFG